MLGTIIDTAITNGLIVYIMENTKLGISIKNFIDAVNIPSRIKNHILSSMSISEAKKRLKKGDHIYCMRTSYSHHGIYDGIGYVYEYGGNRGDFNGVIARVSLEQFAKGDDIIIREYESNFSPEQIITRAKSRLGEDAYDVLTNNCEHFAYWCRLGLDESSDAYSALMKDYELFLNNMDLSGLENIEGTSMISRTYNNSRMNASFRNIGTEGEKKLNEIISDNNDSNRLRTQLNQQIAKNLDDLKMLVK